MAKYRRYRKYTRRGKSKWSSNIVDIGPSSFVLANQGWNSTELTLITNPDYSNQLTSNLYTIKNVEVAINFDTAAVTNQGLIENLQFYIMYVPQSMSVQQDYPIKHPEYIMAMRYYGEPGLDAQSGSITGTTTPAYRIKTRLSRKLNTGDRVILFIRANNMGAVSVNTTAGGICIFWTKAN